MKATLLGPPAPTASYGRMADTSAAGIMPRVLPKPRGAPGSAVSTPSAPHSSGFSLRSRNLDRHALLRGCRLAKRATAPPRRQRLACRPPSRPRAQAAGGAPAWSRRPSP